MAIDKPDKLRSVQRPTGWTDVLAPEVIRQFTGKHIAIIYKRVVASGDTAKVVLEQSLQLFPDETPYLAYIPTPEEALAAEMDLLSKRDIKTATPLTSISAPQTDPSKTFVSVTASIAAPAPSVRFVSPTRGAVGATVRLLGQNLTNVSAVHFAGHDAAYFEAESDESLIVIVPDGATSGDVTVLAKGGDEQMATVFTVLPRAPTIDSFNPRAAPKGATVVIAGTGFADVVEVKFNSVSAEFAISLPTSLTAVVPIGAESGQIRVSTPWESVVSGADFTVISPPKVIDFIPQVGPAESEVVVIGENLAGVLNVTIGGVPVLRFAELSSTELQIFVSAEARSGYLTILTVAGAGSSATKFTVQPPPLVKSVTPDIERAGLRVMITGSSLTGATSVAFNGQVASKFTVISATFISVEVPDGASTGPVTVHTPTGTATTATDFVVILPPIIASISPIAGPVGTKVTITGENFGPKCHVLMGDRNFETVDAISTETIVVEIGEHAVNGVFKVVTAGGIATGSTSFTIIPLPTISSFTPSFGAVGTVITVVGTNLERSIAATVGGIRTKVIVINDAKAKVFVPSEAVSGTVTLMTAYGFCESSSSFEVVSASAITEILPPSGIAGSVVSINGWGFKSVGSVVFGEIRSPDITVDSQNHILAQVPYGAATGDVVVEVPSGTAFSSEPFEVTLSVVSIKPTIGPAGTKVTLVGVGFSEATQVEFGGAAGEFEIVSDTEIYAIAAPSGANGAIRVETKSGSTYSPVKFLYPPEIIRFSPASGPSGTLIGVEVSPNIDLGVEDCEVQFSNGVKVLPSYVDVLDRVVYVLLPADASTGNLVLVTGSGAGTSEASFEVTLV